MTTHASSNTAHQASTPLLVADGVGVEIDGAELLAPTSLHLVAGECVAVRGQNGAGKTTLLRVLTGRLRASSGSVRLRDEPLDERRADHRAAIAALIEPPTLYPDLTLQDQVALIEAAWLGARTARDVANPGLGADAIEVFGLQALRERFPQELSSGQRQLVSLAVTFARPADVLILDEPEQRLDPDRRSMVAEAMLLVRERGAAIAFATHDAALVERVADREMLIGGA